MAEEKMAQYTLDKRKQIRLFGGTGSRQYVPRPPNTEYVPRFTAKTVKHRGTKMLVWACFSYYVVGSINLIKEVMDQRVYVDISENTMLLYAV